MFACASYMNDAAIRLCRNICARDTRHAYAETYVHIHLFQIIIDLTKEDDDAASLLQMRVHRQHIREVRRHELFVRHKLLQEERNEFAHLQHDVAILHKKCLYEVHVCDCIAPPLLPFMSESMCCRVALFLFLSNHHPFCSICTSTCVLLTSGAESMTNWCCKPRKASGESD